MILKIDSRLKNALLLAFVLVLILFGMMYGGIWSLAAFIICGVYFVLGNEDVVIADLFFLLPFASVFKYTSSSTSFLTVLLLAVMILFLIKRSGRIKKNIVIICGALFVVFMLVINILHGNVGITEVAKHLSGILLIYYILEKRESEALKRVIVFFGIGLYISSFIALFADSIPNFYEYVRHVGHNLEITNRFTGFNGDPNYYNISLMLALLGSLAIYKENKPYFWLSFAFTFFFGVQTYSKSFLISLLMVIVIIFVEFARMKNTKVSSLLFVIVIAVMLYMFSSGYFRSVDFILSRFTDSSNVSELTTGRSDIWLDYLGHIFSDFRRMLFGSGISAPLLNHRGSHNFYIELLYYFGIIGTGLFGTMVVSAYRIANGSARRKFNVSHAATVVVLALYFSLQALFSNELYFQIVYIYILCMYCMSQEPNITVNNDETEIIDR